MLCSKPWLVKWWSLLWAQLLWRGCYGADRAGMLGGGREARILPILVTMRGYTRNYHHQSRPLRPPPDTEYPSAPSRSHQSWSTLNLGRYYGTNCWGATDGHMQWDLDPTRSIKTFFIVIFSKHLRCGEQYQDPENISIPLLCERWAVSGRASNEGSRSLCEVLQSRRRPLLGPSPGWKWLLPLSHWRHY